MKSNEETKNTFQSKEITLRVNYSLREKGCFCSKEQVFFTNGPELHHYRDGGAFLLLGIHGLFASEGRGMQSPWSYLNLSQIKPNLSKLGECSACFCGVVFHGNMCLVKRIHVHHCNCSLNQKVLTGQISKEEKLPVSILN